jgi:hypothetical protein
MTRWIHRLHVVSLGGALQLVLLACTVVVSVPQWLAVAAWAGADTHRLAGPERYSIPLASPLDIQPPKGLLGPPINFGSRCTLVDAAAILEYYGASMSQYAVALALSVATDYSEASPGLPLWAYVSAPGQRPLLDAAIERVAGDGGVTAHAHTTLGLNFAQAVAAISHNQPIILNVLWGPDGEFSHSLLAYGYDVRDQHDRLLVIDPDTQHSHWVGPETDWSWTVTSTFITPEVVT